MDKQAKTNGSRSSVYTGTDANNNSVSLFTQEAKVLTNSRLSGSGGGGGGNGTPKPGRMRVSIDALRKS